MCVSFDETKVDPIYDHLRDIYYNKSWRYKLSAWLPSFDHLFPRLANGTSSSSHFDRSTLPCSLALFGYEPNRLLGQRFQCKCPLRPLELSYLEVP
jgi:hypothetical protein